MKILIDVQGLQTASGKRGIGRYTTSLISKMIELKSEWEFHLLCNSRLEEGFDYVLELFSGLVCRKNIHLFESFQNVDILSEENNLYREVSELLREGFISQIQPDVLLITSLFEGMSDPAVTSVHKFEKNIPVVTILYDLIPLIRKELYIPTKGHKSWYFKKVSCLKNSDLLLAISESSSREAIEHLDVKNVDNISTATNSFFKKLDYSESKIKQIYSKHKILKEKFILGVGHPLDPRKNVETLIKAFSLLDNDLSSKVCLVIVGGAKQHENAWSELLTKRNLSKNDVVTVDYISDEDLRDLYNLCEIFVFPSIHEGFGLPALEAIQCGAVAIGSNTTSIPEVIGNDKALFEPKCERSISEKIEKILKEDSYQKELKRYQSEHIKTFSWERTAKLAIKSIEKLKCDFGKVERIDESDELLIKCLAEKIRDISDRDLREISSFVAKNKLPEKRQLLIDVSALVKTDDKSGIQRVVKAILSYFLDVKDRDYAVRPVYRDFDKYRYANQFFDEAPSNKKDLIIDVYNNDIFFGADLDLEISPLAEKCHREMKRKGVKRIHLVYDLIPVKFKQYCHPAVVEAYERWLTFVTSEADKAICISKAVADELKDYMLDTSEVRDDLSIKHFHLGANLPVKKAVFLTEEEQAFLKQISGKKCFLMVGTIEARKGHSQVLSAFEELWEEGLDYVLIFVGKPGWKVEDLLGKLSAHKELNKRVYHLSGVSDSFLNTIYSKAGALIQASYSEGFGLPLIEAAFHEVPMIVRDIPVFREVADDHAFYFENSNSASVVSSAIKSWVKLNELDKHPKSAGMPYLNWDASISSLEKEIFS